MVRNNYNQKKKSGERMKIMWIVGLGAAIWGISLLWPGINRIPGWPVAIGLILGSGSVTLTFILDKLSHKYPEDSGHGHPSRPVHITAVQ